MERLKLYEERVLLLGQHLCMVQLALQCIIFNNKLLPPSLTPN
jgi:hypothetical protein